VSNSSAVAVREIRPGESLDRFIDFPDSINRGDPNWIAPLRMSVKAALDRRKHPFHAHAEVAYFLAEVQSRPVGRIAAIINRRHNEYHRDRVGFFGLFDCVDDAAIAQSLFAAASSWLRARGMESLRGPFNFSTNDEIGSPGVLIEGFDSPPMLMMGHNPAYYDGLFTSSGFAKAKDLVAFSLDDPDAAPERGARIVDRLLAREGVTVRSLDLKNFKRDVDRLKEVYNSAWSLNWGFVPMTEDEFQHLAKEFRPIVDPDVCLLAEVGDEPVGFYLAMPNLNDALRHLRGGRLLPFGWAKLLWYKRKVRSVRVMTVGFKPRFHHAGLGPALYIRAWNACVRNGYVFGEGSWVLEDNLEMVRAMERMGGKPYKRYRVYEQAL
jgi:GNAT superfamily N-acetyltransferase